MRATTHALLQIVLVSVMAGLSTQSAGAAAQDGSGGASKRTDSPQLPLLPARSARTQRYNISARLSEDATKLTGSQIIEFDNPSPSSITVLEFHLYWNGWKNTSATWNREQRLGGGRRTERRVRDDSYGSIDVKNIVMTAAGVPKDGAIPALPQPLSLTDVIQFAAPDDHNPDDETVMKVPLPVPLGAGESIRVELEFENLVPRVIARTGRKDDFVLFAHWYPQLGVYEKRTDGSWGWNTHQFHVNTEFFGEYSNYDVTLFVPLKYEGRVGATGKLVGGPDRTPEAIRYRYQQNDVHNFAWTADPRFIVEKRLFLATDEERAPKYAAERDRVAAATGLPPEELRLSNVEITLLLQPEHANQADRHFKAATESLLWYGIWYGRYPYETLTVVDPRHGSGSGGMEYPTLITAGTRIRPTPGTFTPEGVTVHEFGHQHFYGLIGSNEFEHAWMDEGLTTYSTARTLAAAYGAEIAETAVGNETFGGVPVIPASTTTSGAELLFSLHSIAFPTFRESKGFPILGTDTTLRWMRELPFLNYVPMRKPPVDGLRASFLGGSSPEADRLSRHSYQYVDGAAYTKNSYHKPAALFVMLERIAGPEKWARIMRAYAARHRFQHPRPDDFFKTFVEYAGAEIDGAPTDRLFMQTFGGSETLDFAVTNVKNNKVEEPRGWFGRGPAMKRVAPAAAGDGATEPAKVLYEPEFTVQRLGAIQWPVEIEYKRVGEPPKRERFDGVERWYKKVLPAGAAIEWVHVDPDRKLFIDANYINNYYKAEGDGRAAMKWALRALTASSTQLQFFGGLR